MSLVIYSNIANNKLILAYIYDHLSKTQNIVGHYLSCDKEFVYEYHYRGEKKFFHFIIPENGIYTIEGIEIELCDYFLNNEVLIVKNKETLYPVKKITMKASNNDIIKTFIEKAINTKHQELENLNSISINKVKKKIFTKYCWSNHSTIPKRELNTLFLKEGQIEKINEAILSFIQKDSYNDYIKHGIPYKMNILLHGSPGVGKTSLIHAIASLCDADICMLNINQDLKENELIDAFRSIHDSEKLSILVIEDIDCIFNDRKAHDTHKNNITLNGLLNCLDGFNSQEGLILVLTTNFPDKLDDALIRSCRIDLNIEMTILDKYQAKNMFMSFFPDENAFEKLWENISKYNVEPSTLLQFLFNNRKSSNIQQHFPQFFEQLYKKSHKTCNMYT